MGSIANLRASLEWELDDFQRGTRAIENAFGNVIGLAGRVGEAVANAGKRMTVGMTLPIGGLSAVLTKVAADTAELQSAFDYTFGGMSARMNRWADESGDAMGRATTEMQQGALAFGQLFKAAAPTEQAAARLSQRFTELAQDASSFYNTDFETAMGKIRSGLTGEAEPLRDFGVFLNEAAVETKALEMGLIKAGQELTEYGKIMARSALITEGLSAAQGDIARTSDSLANRVRKIKADLHELAIEIGQLLVPYAQALAGAFENVVSAIRDLPDWVKQVAVGFGVFLAAIGPVLVVLSTMATLALPLLAARFLAARVAAGPMLTVLSAMVNPVGTLVVVVGKLAAQLGALGVAGRLAGRVLVAMTGPIGLLVAGIALLASSTQTSGEKLDNLKNKTAEMERASDELNRRFAIASGATDDLGAAADKASDKVGGLAGSIRMAIDAAETLIETLNRLGITRLMNERAEIKAQRRELEFNANHPELTQTTAGAALERVGKTRRKRFNTKEALAELDRQDAILVENMNKRMKAHLMGIDLDSPVGGDGPIYGTSPDKPARKAKSEARSSGPSEEDLARRRAAIELEHALELARESNDEGAIRALERQRDLINRIDRYRDAGLGKAEAIVAAEKDMAEIDAARVKAREDFLQTYLVETEYQIAVINNDAAHLRYLDDEAELRDRILDLQRAGYDLATAERIAQDAMLQIEKARADAAARRLRDQEQAHELELARLRGDSADSIRAREEEMRIGDRVDELTEDGRMSRAEAEAQAMREAADRSQAHMQGTFRDAFRNGLQAALDGNLGDFFEGWLKDRAFNALSNVLDRLADALANLLAGGQQGGGQGGGGFFAALGNILGAVGGSGGGFGSGGPITEGGAMGSFSAIPGGRATALPKWNSGGRGIIKGHPGIDRNLLSINGVPSAFVSRGEQLSVMPQGGAARGGGAVKVIIEDTTGLFRTRVQQISGDTFAAGAPSLVEGAGKHSMATMARRNSRRVG